jgi:hypothetical protein
MAGQSVQNSSAPGPSPMSGASRRPRSAGYGHPLRCAAAARPARAPRRGQPAPAGSPAGAWPGPEAPELRRFAGCGQATPRSRPGDLRRGTDRPARPRRARRAPGPRPPPAARPPAIPRSWKAGRNSPDSGLPRDFRDAIARILRTRACKGLQRFTNAELRRRGIQPARYPDENSATRDPGPSPGITGTPGPPRTGRVPPPGRAARGRSARCRPARAGRPAPRLRRAPGTAGHPGRTGP